MNDQETDLTNDSEQSLLERARNALSQCNWVVGECAAEWTERYARGRTDADFGSQIGLSGDQIYQRRRVWESFHDVRSEYPELKWSHFYVSLNWDDSSECLNWAQENQATVAEMRAWRRSVHGEDLTTDADPLGIQVLDFAPTSIREPEMAMAGGEGGDEIPFEPTGNSSGGDDNTPYSPYRKDARGDAPSSTEGPEYNSPKPIAAETPDRIVKRAITSIKRSDQQLSELSVDQYNEVDPDLVAELRSVAEDLAATIERLE